MYHSFNNKSEFRRWLELNCLQESPIWIAFYKDGRVSLTYPEAVEVALCFGWIDSKLKKVDEVIYIQQFTKRRKNSKWSEKNKALVARLIDEGLMTELGFAAIIEAKENGEWERKDERIDFVNVQGLREMLIAEKADIQCFDNLSESLKTHYSMVYYSAKTEATRKKRIAIVIEYMKTRKRFL